MRITQKMDGRRKTSESDEKSIQGGIDFIINSLSSTLFRLAGEVPLPEDIIMRVLTLGSRPEFPLLPQEALEVTDKIIRRAAMVHSKGRLY